MTLVCFDSNFVIWGIKRQATPGQETFVGQVEHSFVLAGFGAAAATQFARLWRSRQRTAAFTRSETKADYLIAAIALANGCEVIYSGDLGLRRFAEPHIPVRSIDAI